MRIATLVLVLCALACSKKSGFPGPSETASAEPKIDERASVIHAPPRLADSELVRQVSATIATAYSECKALESVSERQPDEIARLTFDADAERRHEAGSYIIDHLVPLLAGQPIATARRIFPDLKKAPGRIDPIFAESGETPREYWVAGCGVGIGYTVFVLVGEDDRIVESYWDD